MPTDLGMKYITRHVLGTCRHTRHFYLDPSAYLIGIDVSLCAKQRLDSALCLVVWLTRPLDVDFPFLKLGVDLAALNGENSNESTVVSCWPLKSKVLILLVFLDVIFCNTHTQF